MLTDKELRFVENWEKVRVEYSGTVSKFKRGLPMAILFSLPIILSVVAVYFFSPEWYTKIGQRAGASSFAIVLAVVLCTFFFSFFRMHFKWEMNEQLYLELKSKQKQSASEAGA